MIANFGLQKRQEAKEKHKFSILFSIRGKQLDFAFSKCGSCYRFIEHHQPQTDDCAVCGFLLHSASQ